VKFCGFRTDCSRGPGRWVNEPALPLVFGRQLVGYAREWRDAPLFRIAITPSTENGLRKPSQVMVDKAHTVSREKLSHPIGRLENDALLSTTRALAVFVGIA